VTCDALRPSITSPYCLHECPARHQAHDAAPPRTGDSTSLTHRAAAVVTDDICQPHGDLFGAKQGPISRNGRRSACTRRGVVVYNTVAVNVAGIEDESTVDAVRRTVRATLGHLVGTWQVKISASEDSRHWDLRLSGPFGHHLAHFLSEPTMPDAVDRRLRAFLGAVAPPLSQPHGRPRNRGTVIRLQAHVFVADRTARRQQRPAASRQGFGLPPCDDDAFATVAAAAHQGGQPVDGGRSPLPN
jgi:hypothetical protein